MKKATLLFISFLIIASCGGTQYRDPARDRGSREWGPKEIKDTVKIMVKSLYGHLKARKRPAYPSRIWGWRYSRLISLKKARRASEKPIKFPKNWVTTT